MAGKALPPLWRCPKCGAQFVSANMWHSCGRFRVEDLFTKCEPQVFELYRRFKRMVERCGPVVEIPQKTAHERSRGSNVAGTACAGSPRR
jgi:hypothetical protein